MTSFRRPNGSIIGSSVIPTSTSPSTAPGLWDKNEHYSLVGIGYWPGLAGSIVTYNFTSNISTATFFDTTLQGRFGASGSGSLRVASIGGTYTITAGSQHLTTTSGVNGGNGSGTVSSGGYTYGGGGGGIGGNSAIGTTGGATGYDFNGVWNALTIAGYSPSGSSFGKGGNGSLQASENGAVFGGGGGGRSDSYGGGAGGRAGIVIQCGDLYATVIDSLSGSGSFTCPSGSTYVKIWCIGKGGNGSGGIYGHGGGGAAGGIAYARFD
jgi:hypothetical protein